MPFKKADDEHVIWRDPTLDDISKNRAAVFNEEEDGIVFVSPEVETQVQSAISTLIPQFGQKFASEINERLYSSLKALADEGELGTCDIILPVHNAIHVTEKCIKAALENTHWPYNLIVVDDASDSFTNRVLRKYADEGHIKLLTNKKNRGFAATVNRGIRNGRGKYVVLLNSDVIVTDMWLTKMILALEADSRNQIVNPATNNTAIIDIPMSEGASYLSMNKIFEHYSQRRYPEIMPTGFCFLFRRDLLDKIGVFDEAYKSFGEESDFWMRTITYADKADYPRFRAVMADDAYVFHERGSSFSALGEHAHLSLRKGASGRFHKIWPEFAHWRKSYSPEKDLKQLRKTVAPEILNKATDMTKYRICWVVSNASYCGGMKYITDVVNEINERGGDARVALVRRGDEENNNVPVLGELRSGLYVFDNPDQFTSTFTSRVFPKGIVAAATSSLSPLVRTLTDANEGLTPLLHTQSYEPDLLTDEDMIKESKERFDLIPDIISNSHWISNELQGKPFATISPGVDRNLFYPGDRSSGDDRFTIMMPMLQTYPFKGYDRGVKLIHALWKRAQKENIDVRILVYGVDRVPEVPVAIGLGQIPQTRLASLLRQEVDVFVDPSLNHSYGMPYLEAIASGVKLLAGWNNKGIKEYFSDSKFILPSDADAEDVANVIFDAAKSSGTNTQVIGGPNPLSKMLEFHDREKSVDAFIEAIEKHFRVNAQKRKIVVVTPHMRKHGGPTTILHTANLLAKRGHDVSITSVYADINPEVVAMTDLPINLDPKDLPECDLLITNSDNPMNKEFSEFKGAKKKILLKLSHNARFKQLENDSLKLPWDAVITSSDWLADVCENPLKDWDHPSVKATRVGWYHYAHELMKRPIGTRNYGNGKDIPFVVGTLIHHHPLKGTKEAMKVLLEIKKKYGKSVEVLGIGEVDPNQFKAPAWMSYVFSPNRDKMANVLAEVDVWLGASHTEGLGRLALEAMSAGAACVLTDTGAEFATDNDNCLIVPIGDDAAMTEKVDLLLQDPDLIAQIRAKGYKTAEDYSDPTNYIDNLEDVIIEVFNG